jgi:hypothetical protein
LYEKDSYGQGYNIVEIIGFKGSYRGRRRRSNG